jgi:putative OPT family oligopeptide transporter
MTISTPTPTGATRILDGLPELTLRGLILGALITVIFTAANVYLGLKVGLTFASSIPAAVISMAVLRLVPKSNILENNMVQTLASAAGTLSSIIFIIPGLVLMGYWTGFPFWYTAGICAAGGVLGVMYTIPLRRAMVVDSDLPYPEGIAAAEILRVGSPDADGATTQAAGEPGLLHVIVGTLISGFYAFASTGLGVLGQSATWWWRIGTAIGSISTGLSFALVGAGYLAGVIVGVAMLVGVLIAWAVTIPILTMLHPLPDGVAMATYATGLFRSQVRFLGAGAIAVASIWTLIQLIGPVFRGLKASISAMSEIKAGRGDLIPRTERDMPFNYVAMISLAMIPPLAVLFGSFLIDTGAAFTTGQLITLVAFAIGFSFVFGLVIAATCGYMAGLVGSSNSPISGIGIMAVVGSALLLGLYLGSAIEDPSIQRAAIALAIFITSAVLAIATVSNDNLQDLKTGQLVQATPWKQQVSLIVGVVVGSLVIPPILDLLYNAYGFGDVLPRPGMDPHMALAAPQATLMKALATGILGGNVNWTMIGIGAIVGVALITIDELLKKRGGVARLPVLAVGIGIYLPADVSVPITLGGLLAWAVDKGLAAKARNRKVDFESLAERPRRAGTLVASGFIVGESLFGVLLAALIGATGSQSPLAIVGDAFEDTATWLGTAVFAVCCFAVYRWLTNVKEA